MLLPLRPSHFLWGSGRMLLHSSDPRELERTIPQLEHAHERSQLGNGQNQILGQNLFSIALRNDMKMH